MPDAPTTTPAPAPARVHGPVRATLAALPLADGWRVVGAADTDAGGLVRLVGGCFVEYPGCVLDLPDLDADLLAWGSALRSADGAGWVVRDERGELVASVGVAPSGVEWVAPSGVEGVAPSGAGTCELKRLYVDRVARRRGLGAALVAVVEAWARHRGAGRVELWSDTRFTDAHRLYERLGYADTGARRDLHDPSHTTELHMARTLAP